MTDSTDKGERIAKRLSRVGLCSRREAERWIADGRVAVGGKVIATPATTVTDADRVTVDGKPVQAPEPTRLWLYHKPSGLICTARDERGRATIFDRLPAELPRVMSVGRLDVNSEGLLLLTNDGGLARRLELPATGWLRRYRVRLFGRPDEAAVARLAKGLVVDGVRYGPVQATLDSVAGANAWMTLALREGKNREVRILLSHLGYRVNRLIRVAFGPFQLGKLAAGAVREVPRKVVGEQLGAALDAPPSAGTRRRHADRRR